MLMMIYIIINIYKSFRNQYSKNINIFSTNLLNLHQFLKIIDKAIDSISVQLKSILLERLNKINPSRFVNSIGRNVIIRF